MSMFVPVVFVRCFALFLTVGVVCAVTPLHRIGVNPARPFEFRDTVTGLAFFPEGVNYVYPVMGRNFCEFNAHPTDPTKNLYDAGKAESSLAQLQQNGYNVVRIVMSIGGCPDDGGPYFGIGGHTQSTSPALSPAYLANIVDFLRRANNHRIYVIPVLSFVPYTSYYQDRINRHPGLGGINRFYLGEHALEAKKEYVRRFVQAIRSHDPNLLSTVFAYELENEVELAGNALPFSVASGSVRTADGNTYDMTYDPTPTPAQRQQRQQCMDANLVLWANGSASAVREGDPAAMVTASVFTHRAVGKAGHNGLLMTPGGNERFPARPLVFHVWAKELSYIDVHLYPIDPAYNIDHDLASSEVPAIRNQPLIMGEFGTCYPAHPTVVAGALALRGLREQAYARSFQGSLHWTFDWPRDSSVRCNDPKSVGNPFYPTVEQNGAINGVLAPVLRVTAKSSQTATPPYLATDGLTSTAWIASDALPQHLQIDLGRARRISRITMTVRQPRDGPTTHVVTGGTTSATSTTLGTINRSTSDGQQLQLSFTARDLRYLRITTTRSPSRAGWKEITVQ